MARDDFDVEVTEYVAGHSQALRQFAFLLTGNLTAADDLVQTTLVKVVVAWHRVRRSSNVDSYVRRVMVNTALSWRRRRWGGELPTAELPDVGDDREAISSADTRVVLWGALRALPPRQRAVVLLRYHEDLSERDVAAVLDVSVGTVKSQAARGLTKLRLALQASGYPDSDAAPRDLPPTTRL